MAFGPGSRAAGLRRRASGCVRVPAGPGLEGPVGAAAHPSLPVGGGGQRHHVHAVLRAVRGGVLRVSLRAAGPRLQPADDRGGLSSPGHLHRCRLPAHGAARAAFGPRPLIVIGAIIAGSGLIWLSGISPTSTYFPDLFGPFVLMGVGMGLAMMPVPVAATTGMNPEEAGLLSGLLNTSRTVGAAIGLAGLTTVAANRTTEALDGLPAVGARGVAALTDGFALALGVSGVVLLLTAVVALVTIPARARCAKRWPNPWPNSSPKAPSRSRRPEPGRDPGRTLKRCACCVSCCGTGAAVPAAGTETVARRRAGHQRMARRISCIQSSAACQAASAWRRCSGPCSPAAG